MEFTIIGRVVLLSALMVLTASAANRDPAQWEKDIKAFEASDRTNPPPTNAVLFVGSSSIRLWTNLAESFPNYKTIGRGFGGSHITDAVAFADRIIIPYRPAKVVVYAGENDIARGDSAQDVYDGFRELVAKVQRALPHAPIYYIAMKPSPSRWHLSPQLREGNRLIQNYCARKNGVVFIDIWPAMIDAGQPDGSLFVKDNLHLNAKGYARWAKLVGHALEKGE